MTSPSPGQVDGSDLVDTPTLVDIVGNLGAVGILADVEMEFSDIVHHAVTPAQSFTHVSPTSHQIFMVMG